MADESEPKDTEAPDESRWLAKVRQLTSESAAVARVKAFADEVDPEHKLRSLVAKPGETVEDALRRLPTAADLKAFVKEHPTAALATAAGVGALSGVGWAAGALFGLGAATLLNRKSGPEVREEIAKRGRAMAEALANRLDRIVGPKRRDQPPVEPAPTSSER